MNTDWLRYFIILAKTGNFHKAAEIIGISVPTLSNAIASLEKYYKLTLINRVHNIKNLTPAGEKFFEKAEEIIKNIDFVNNKMAEMNKSEVEGAVSICEVELSKYFVPNVFQIIMAKYPKIKPNLYSMTNDKTLPFLLNGKIDLAVLHEPPVLPELNYVRGNRFPYVIVGKNPEIKEWNEVSYISFSLINGAVETEWPEEKFKRNIIIETDSVSTALELCEREMGCVYVPEIIIRNKLESGELNIVSQPPFETYSSLTLVWSKNLVMRPSVSVVLDFFMKELLKTH